MMDLGLEKLAREEFCNFGTTDYRMGYREYTRLPFVLDGNTLYVFTNASTTQDWVENVRHEPRVTPYIGGKALMGEARFVEAGEEDARIRQLYHQKYAPFSQDDLDSVAQLGQLVAVEFGVIGEFG